MNRQLIKTLFDQVAAGQVPPLEMVYGCCRGLLSQTPDWTAMKFADDTGEIVVYIKSSIINVSDSLTDECMLVVNDSTKSSLGRDGNGQACLMVVESRDLWLRRPAYDEYKRREAGKECAPAGAAAAQQAAEVVQAAAAATSQVAAAVPAATETQASAQVLELAQEHKLTGQAPEPIRQLPTLFALMGAMMLDSLETAKVVTAEYVRRHPEDHSLLEPRSVQTMATTFFIQSARGGAWSN